MFSCSTCVAIVVMLVLPLVSTFDQCRSLSQSTTAWIALATQSQHNLKIRSRQCVQQNTQQLNQIPLQATSSSRLKSRFTYNTRTTFPIDISMIFNNNNVFNDDEYEEDEIQQDRVDEYLEFLERRYQ
jgi:aspartyl/asparaginyl beta-hydroxylase (cupin superfamily)